MFHIPTVAEKCTGALLASAIGDALGWPNELRANNTEKSIKAGNRFSAWTRHSGGRAGSHIEEILPGQYNGSTQLVLAVARSLMTDNWEKALAFGELPYWLEYERGGSLELRDAAALLKNGVLPWESAQSGRYFMAGGNGAAKRILPHVICNHGIETLIADVVKDTLYTHGHPRAILGASCYAYALHFLMNRQTISDNRELVGSVIDGAEHWSILDPDMFPKQWHDLAGKNSGFDYLRAWSDIASEMVEKLKYINDSLIEGLVINDGAVLKHLECFDQSRKGDVASLSSLYLASKYANTPALGIRTTADLLGADTGAIASMTGGLLGMLCGTAWIPTGWRQLQDLDCFVNISEILLSRNMTKTLERVTKWPEVQHNDWEDSPIGRMRLLSTKVVATAGAGALIIDKMETMLGQTLYLRRFEEKEDTVAPGDIEQDSELQRTGRVRSKRAVFALDSKSVRELSANPLLRQITFKKALQIMNLLLEENDVIAIASRLSVCKEAVEIIKGLMIEGYGAAQENDSAQ